MAYPSLVFKDVLAAIAGPDAHLAEELRAALISAAASYADLLARARCDANWQVAARRLAGLAASFSATELQLAAQEALAGVPGDPVALRRIQHAIAHLQL